MSFSLPEDRMPEAEVSLRLALYLLALPGAENEIEVAIDGAQIKVHGDVVFPITAFLASGGWRRIEQIGRNAWQGWYERSGQRLWIHSRSGVGDVVAEVLDQRIRVECKGGPLIKKRGSQEYPRLRGALGHVITVADIAPQDLMAVAVPCTPKFCELACRWREAPLVMRAGIQILLVGRDRSVDGLSLAE